MKRWSCSVCNVSLVKISDILVNIHWNLNFYMQILPQAVCTRYGLAIGAALAPVVQILVWICFPVAYPISKVTYFGYVWMHLIFFEMLIKCFSMDNWFSPWTIIPFGGIYQLLDRLLGKDHDPLFRRAELKTLVDLHGNEVLIFHTHRHWRVNY